MIPIALEWAIGLERLSPLAVVAMSGLLISTFLTIVFVPILYTLFGDAESALRRLLGRGPSRFQTPAALPPAAPCPT